MSGRRLPLFVAVGGLALLGVWGLWPSPDAPSERPWPSFVAAETCFGCHQDQALRWQGSDHQRAMQVASDASVLGDFNDAAFVHGGVTTRFSRRDGAFVVETYDASGAPRSFDVAYTLGVKPLQQVLVAMEDGRVQCLLTAWDTERNRWFALYGEPIPHTDELHWTGRMQNWNFMCAECHSTNLRRNYDEAADTYHTTWSEISVGCQACHGPGSDHVAWARIHAGTEYAPDDPKGLVVRLEDPDPRVQVEHCARCHSRRSLVTDAYRHGDRFLDHYDLQLLGEPYYTLDGQILDEVYVYGSFLQTKKHAQGVRCTDCHDPHSARLKHEGNTLCLQCHQENPPERFPTLKKKVYDSKAHTFHDPGLGSACVDCHMPARTYMQVDPRRDHSFRVPRPDLSVSIGTPNACNGCHQDKSAEWAAREVAAWFPGSERRQKPHFAQAMAIAARGHREAPEWLASVIADEEQAGIVRATAVARLGAFRGPIAQQVLQACLSDEEPLVRAAAVSALIAQLPRRPPPGLGQTMAAAIGPLLSDPIRLVRVEAASAMAKSVGRDVPEVFREPMAAARREYVERQQAYFDRPDGHYNLGVLFESEGDLAAAESHYSVSLERHADFLPARMNRAMLRNTLGRNSEAREDFELAIRYHPRFGEAWYSLGLLLGEMDDLPGAARALSEAAVLMPAHPRVHFNLGVVQEQLGHLSEAESAYQEAQRFAPNDPDLIHALVMLFKKQERWFDAHRWAVVLVQLAPGQPGPAELLRELREKLPR